MDVSLRPLGGVASPLRTVATASTPAYRFDVFVGRRSRKTRRQRSRGSPIAQDSSLCRMNAARLSNATCGVHPEPGRDSLPAERANVPAGCVIRGSSRRCLEGYPLDSCARLMHVWCEVRSTDVVEDCWVGSAGAALALLWAFYMCVLSDGRVAMLQRCDTPYLYLWRISMVCQDTKDGLVPAWSQQSAEPPQTLRDAKRCPLCVL